MKSSSLLLFMLRLCFYFSVIILIFAHPGISVSFDRIGIMQWIIIIPLMAAAAYQSLYSINSYKRFLFVLILLMLLSLIAAGFDPNALSPFASGLISFAFTSMLFHRDRFPLGARWAKLTMLEPFFFAWVCLRLLSLSRSGEEIAGQSMALTQFILVWTAAVFLLHSAVIYLCLYPESRVKAWKEGVLFISGAAVILMAVLVILPPDFVSNAVIENLIPERIPERIRESSDNGIPNRNNGRRTLPANNNGSGELRGIPEHNWSGGGGDNRQYMVMIVASGREPVYMGDAFRGQLDPVKGFLLSPHEPMNDLAQQRFFVTWSNSDYELDLKRDRQEVFSLSTLRQKFLPYRPVVIDPVILSEDTGPLRYIHQVVSNTHLGDPLNLVRAPSRHFYEHEKNAYSHYLEIELDNTDKNIFQTYLNNAVDNWKKNKSVIIQNDPYIKEIFSGMEELGNEYIENIIAILTGFSQYQYNLNKNDDYSIAALKDFLLNRKEGDCVEFSNTLALLGRLAGIPSRVVTGYIAAEGLQTPAHLRGLSVLRGKIPALQQFPFDNLYMVTNIHRHSWTQFFIPDYGWLDFESTSFAIPPAGMGDFNNWDVVIPVLDDNRTFSQVKKFPWQAVARAFVILIIAAIFLAYALRFGREFVLYLNSQKSGRAGARSLYLLLLARLAADGQPVKPASKTAHEYSELFNFTETRQEAAKEIIKENCFKLFADIYSEIRWRQFANQSEMDEKFNLLKQEYFNILKTTKRKGLHRFIIRVISLRGLAYL
ncbi:MAG: transglutaminase family protein [Treponema sp.]|nr:transglutaminase family protein [Treponema sp.]